MDGNGFSKLTHSQCRQRVSRNTMSEGTLVLLDNDRKCGGKTKCSWAWNSPGTSPVAGQGLVVNSISLAMPTPALLITWQNVGGIPWTIGEWTLTATLRQSLNLNNIRWLQSTIHYRDQSITNRSTARSGETLAQEIT